MARQWWIGLALSGLVASMAGCAAWQERHRHDTGAEAKAATGFTNPVLDHDFADPMVLRASNGWYYAYATQSPRDGR